MKYAALLLLMASFLLAFGQQTETVRQKDENGGSPLLYVDGGGFFIDTPKDWIIDRQVGEQLGTCCVFYPKGSTWGDSTVVMYPSIVKKGPGKQSAREFMESDLAEFRKHDPGMSYEDAEDFPLKLKRVARIRMFYDVNHGSSEAVAYVEEEKIIAVVVVSSKTKKDLKEAIPLLQSALETYTYMDVRVQGASPKPARPAAPTKN